MTSFITSTYVDWIIIVILVIVLSLATLYYLHKNYIFRINPKYTRKAYRYSGKLNKKYQIYETKNQFMRFNRVNEIAYAITHQGTHRVTGERILTKDLKLLEEFLIDYKFYLDKLMRVNKRHFSKLNDRDYAFNIHYFNCLIRVNIEKILKSWLPGDDGYDGDLGGNGGIGDTGYKELESITIIIFDILSIYNQKGAYFGALR